MAFPRETKRANREEAFLITPELDQAAIELTDTSLHGQHSCLHALTACLQCVSNDSGLRHEMSFIRSPPSRRVNPPKCMLFLKYKRGLTQQLLWLLIAAMGKVCSWCQLAYLHLKVKAVTDTIQFSVQQT